MKSGLADIKRSTTERAICDSSDPQMAFWTEFLVTVIQLGFLLALREQSGVMLDLYQYCWIILAGLQQLLLSDSQDR